MKNIKADRFESLLTYLSFGYFAVFFIIQGVFHNYLSSSVNPPIWWSVISTILSYSWLISCPIFIITVIWYGKKIMKNKQNDEGENRNE